MDENIAETKVTNLKNNLAIPIAIVLAGALIAGAIFISNKKTATVANAPQVQKTDATVPPVTPADHILGNPKAKIVIVEYSDLQCPYCQSFNDAMKKIMSEYGKKGEVAWVYRHFWAERKMQDGRIFHPLGGKAAEASECVAELGGNEKFWAFTDNIFENQNTQPEKLTRLSDIAASVGVDKAAFETCLKSGKYTAAIAKAYNEGVAIGVSGTPSSFLITKDGVYPVEGFVPYEELKLIIEDLL